MSFLTRDEILKAEDRKHEIVSVPEWGGDVRLRTLTARERDAFEASTVETNKKGQQRQNLVNLRARLVSLCLVDADGNRLFPETSDVHLLGDKSALALQRVFDKCTDMNGLSDSDVEEMAEDFGGVQSETSDFD